MIDFLQYPLALVVTLGVLITVHEMGHFLVARRSGVRVLRFWVGFGRPLVSWHDRHGTEFAIAMIPLGGYVRMLDEREPGAVPFERRPGDVSFPQLSVWWRMAIAAAGPAANFLLAFIVYWVLLVAGSTTVAPMLGSIPAESPAARAGLEPGLELVAVDGVPTESWQAVTMAFAARLGDSGSIVVDARTPGQASGRAYHLPIVAWHRGEDEPDLLGSLGIEPSLPPVLGEILEDGPAAGSGLRQWDHVVAVDGEPLDTWADWVERVQAAPGRTLEVLVQRAGEGAATVRVTPGSRSGMDGSTIGYVGVAPFVREIRHGVIEALPLGLRETWDKSLLTLDLLRKMVQGDVSVKNLSGPITIAKVAGDSARSGWTYFLGILALLSISLGVLNLMPIPILDGGHIAFCVVEAVRGKPVSERIQVLGTQIGLVLVGGLMMLALYNDFSRLF